MTATTSTEHVDILLVAAEASADRHAARLLDAMRLLRPSLRVAGIGGAALRRAGMQILVDAAQVNVVGFWEVVRRYRSLRAVFGRIVDFARLARPTIAILVDYPGFNLRLARRLHELGIPVVYYVAPQVWAWKEGRVRTIRQFVDRLLVVFPFEVDYFARHDIEAVFFGHPLVDELATHTLATAQRGAPADDARRTVAYLPGSRPEELARHMPVVRSVIERLGGSWRHVVARASTIEPAILEAMLQGMEVDVEVSDDAVEVLADADVALVKSGTSTVEATVLGVPFAAFYRTSAVSYAIARRAIRVPWIAMANILAGRAVVREFIQDACTGEAIAAELCRLSDDAGYRAEVIEGLDSVRRELGASGHAARAAAYIIDRYFPEGGRGSDAGS